MSARGYAYGPGEGDARLSFDHLLVAKVAGEASEGQMVIIGATAPSGGRVPKDTHTEA